MLLDCLKPWRNGFGKITWILSRITTFSTILISTLCGKWSVIYRTHWILTHQTCLPQVYINFYAFHILFIFCYCLGISKSISFSPGQEGQEDITLLAVKLATSFFLESFIHAKEKLNIVQWVELLTKQFDSSTTACSWFLSHMAADNTWAVTIFLKCHVNTIRQMFHRLCIHVIQKLRDMEKSNYLLPWIATDPHELPDEKIRPQVYYFFIQVQDLPYYFNIQCLQKVLLLRIWIKVANNCHYIVKIISF